MRHLPYIPDDRRRDEENVLARVRGGQTGDPGRAARCHRQALARLPGSTLRRKPRLAELRAVGDGGEPALGWPAGPSCAPTRATGRRSGLALDASPLALAVRQLAERHAPAAPWQGTAAELLDQLGQGQTRGHEEGPDWPKTARALSGGLRPTRPACAPRAWRWTSTGGSQAARAAADRPLPEQPAAHRPDRPDRPRNRPATRRAARTDRGTVPGRRDERPSRPRGPPRKPTPGRCPAAPGLSGRSGRSRAPGS